MQNFRKLPAMKRKIAGASNKLGKMNEMIEKIKNDGEIDENIKQLMEQNLRYYVQKEYGIDAGFEKQEEENADSEKLDKVDNSNSNNDSSTNRDCQNQRALDSRRQCGISIFDGYAAVVVSQNNQRFQKMRENKKRKLELEEKKMFDDYIRQQNVSLDYFENAAKNLQELNKEIKEENDKYDERQINEMY